MTNPDKKIIIICGPTGIGKTTIGIRLAQTFNGEIISADSMQIYQKMDIGTAKPTIEEKRLVHHHFIDIVPPDQPFDAAQFSQLANVTISRLLKDNKQPFVVGGTGLYIKALLHGLFDTSTSDSTIKKQLKIRLKSVGAALLHSELTQIDPVAAQKIHPNDHIRIIRALEVYHTTGERISSRHDQHGFHDQNYNALKIGLEMDRAMLYKRINDRVDIMIQQGLLEEVQHLLKQGYNPQLKSMQSIGYRHMADYISGLYEWSEAIRLLKRDTRRYAKRQFTWFKKDKDVKWYHPDNFSQIKDRCHSFLLVSST